MPSINDIYNLVTGLPDLIAALPKKLVAAMRNSADTVVATVSPMQQAFGSLAQPFSDSAAIIQYVAKEGAAVRDKGAQVRAQLTTFIAGLANCGAQVNALVQAVDPKLPQVGTVPAFAGDLVGSVLKNVPDVALVPIAKALDNRPGWERSADDAYQILVLLLPKVGSKDPADQKTVDIWFIEVQTILKMISGLLSQAARLLPRDLNAGLALVGEGGTLTVTGHPIGWVFTLLGTLIDEAQTVLSAAQQLIKLNR